MANCPQCGSEKLFKSGLRHLPSGETIQRLLCRTCGYRFSDLNVKVDVPGQFFKGSNSTKNHANRGITDLDSLSKKVLDGLSFGRCEDVGAHDVSVTGKGLNALRIYSSEHRVGVAPRSAKNLDTAMETKSIAGDRKLDSASAKGILLQFELWLQKEGYGEDSRYKSCIRMLINSGADLFNPEHVKEVIAKKSWKDGTKMQTAYAYDALTKMLKLSWTMPKYRQEEAFPFIPEEKELDALIAGAGSPRMSAYLQTLKETMTDPSEALRIKWIDIKGNVITINGPVKGHYARPIEVSNTLILTLNNLPKTSEYVFPTTYRNVAKCYWLMRRKISKRLCNPRVLSISMVTFRHWGATMLYHHTRDILLVKKLLGHKRIDNTMKYTQLVNFKDDDYEVTTASTEEEIKALGKAGFVKYDEHNGIHFYRKPKRFVSLA